MNHFDVIVVGAGMTGLSTAYFLEKQGYKVAVFEADSEVGGRVRTDVLDGFQLDRGIHFFQSSYPEASKLLDYNALELKNIYPGTLIYKDNKFNVLSNPIKNVSDLFPNLIGGFATLKDRMKLVSLLTQMNTFSEQYILQLEDISALEYLEKKGFSSTFIDSFFRPFIGAVFCDNSLQLSSRLLCYVLKYFTLTQLSLPKNGIGSIPKNIANRFKTTKVFLNSKVKETTKDGIILANGDIYFADKIVLTTTPSDIQKISGNDSFCKRFHHVSCLYFSATSPPISKPIIMLNGEKNGIVNHLFVPSNLHPSYAPNGLHLIGISTLESSKYDDDELLDLCMAQMIEWFGVKANTWTHLKTYHISKALPQINQLNNIQYFKSLDENIIVTGDHLSFGSMNTVIRGGRETANYIHKQLSKKRELAFATI